jgi:hypothetical protein
MAADEPLYGRRALQQLAIVAVGLSLAPVATLATGTGTTHPSDAPPPAIPATPEETSTRTINISADPIELSEAEKTALGAVRDRTKSLDETALYMMLASVAKLEKLSPQELESLSRPSVRNLLAHPHVYRAEAIELNVYVVIVRKLLPGKGLAYTPYWEKDRGVWRMDCLNAAARHPAHEPIVVLSTAEPSFLRKPDETTPDGAKLYRGLGPKVRLAGVFYKVYTALSRGDETVGPLWREYPVVLAWQLFPIRESARPQDLSSGIIMVIVFIGMALGFIVLRRGLKRSPAPEYPYRPRRPIGAVETKGGRKEDDEVDPLLKEAADAYRKERQIDDAKDDQG